MTAPSVLRSRQRGTTALVVAIIMPAILLVITSVAQVIAWEFARQAAQESAALGVEAARLRGGSDSDGARVAAQTADRFRSLHGVSVTVTHPPTGGVEVDVTATTAAVVPGLSIPVGGSATGPVEPRP
jgi:hypothetical protein